MPDLLAFLRWQWTAMDVFAGGIQLQRGLADALSGIDEAASCSLVMASPGLQKWTVDATRL
jgi:hypothetical protein